MSISSEDIQYGLVIVTNSYLDSPSTKITITWLLTESFTVIILDMGSAPHAEFSDVVLYGAFVGTKNCPMDGLVKMSDSISLLRNLRCKQSRQTKPIWNGF